MGKQKTRYKVRDFDGNVIEIPYGFVVESNCPKCNTINWVVSNDGIIHCHDCGAEVPREWVKLTSVPDDPNEEI